MEREAIMLISPSPGQGQGRKYALLSTLNGLLSSSMAEKFHGKEPKRDKESSTLPQI
uniref:Uncharacterized protein n=1 Tax=Nelumbo nucifera TaxID=4432 RepID=A0A822XL00_NELNU|nr:TPA_asm: hypothetical protein HUJ06_021079 [Nelumbo nucifera]